MTLSPTTPTRSSHSSLRLLSVVAAIFALVGAAASTAQSWDPFPKLDGARRLALGAGVDSTPFRSTDDCLRRSYPSGASYYAAVVRVSDPSGSRSPTYSNAVPYVDGLYDAWRASSRIDPSTHILIAVSLDNRGIAIHPGLRWADLGLEGERIRRVVDTSRFGHWARSGEMGRALCVLADAVDDELVDMQKSGRRQVEDLASQLDDAARQRARLHKRATDWDTVYPRLAEGWTKELDRWEDLVSEGRRAVQRGRLGDARSALRQAQNGLQGVATSMDAVQDVHDSLPDLDRDMSRRTVALSSETGAATPSFARARRQWAECRTLRSSLEASLLEGERVGAEPLRNCLKAYDGYLADARTSHRMRYVILPMAVVGGLLLLVLTALLVQALRVRSARRDADSLLGEWQRRLDHVADRLLEIETEFPLYFTADHVRWTGDSRDLDQRCATAVNHVYVLFSEANLLLDRARSKADEVGFTTLQGLDRVRRVLEDTQVLGSGTEQHESKLRLPGALPSVEPCSGSELLGRLEARCKVLTEDLREVIALEERFYELIQESDAVSADAAQAGKARAELGASVESLERRLGPLLDRRRQAMDLLSDPIKANPALESVVRDLKALQADIELGNGTLQSLRGTCAERRHQLTERIQTLRENGFELLEPGLASDLRLDRSLRQMAEIEDTVDAGREKEAAAQLDRLQFGLLELDQQLTTIERTRESLPGQVDALEIQAGELRGRIPAGRKILQSLQDEHAAETFSAESDNLEELDGLLRDFEAWCREIRQDYDAQHYLAAAEDFATGSELVTGGNALLDAVEAIRQELDETRDRARDLGRKLDGALVELSRRGERPGVAAETRRDSEEITKEGKIQLEDLKASRPNWPRLEQDLASTSDLAAVLLLQMEDEIRHLEQAEALAKELTDRLTTLSQRVRAETRDRAFVAEGVDAARSALEAWRTDLGDGARLEGGTSLLGRGEQARSKIQWAEDLWRSEMDLVRAAEAKLAGARDLLRREQKRHFGYGVRASCDDGAAALRDAESRRNRRDWDGVLEASRIATERIQEEVARCRRQVQRREEEERRALHARRMAEQRARRRAAAQAAAAAAEIAAQAAAAAWSSSRTSSSGFGRRRSSFSSRSGGSSSRSGGSSWGGGSRSGGSSW